jgi:AraC-like DNA-binding protein
MHFDFRENQEIVTLVFGCETHTEPSPELVDATLAIICQMCRINYGSSFRPVNVAFVHPKPACAHRIYSFFQSEVIFGAEENSISFATEDMNKRLSGANPYLARVNDKVIIDYLSRLERDDVSHRVKACIIEHLHSGDVTAKTVANKLAMSERSLQRLLKQRKTSFRSLKDEVRKQLSLNYVRDKNIEISEIAFLLGYSEQSAFSRAFKRLTGMAPTEARNRL